MTGCHRAPRWWARHRIATATAAGAAVVVLVVAVAVAVGPRPELGRPQPITAQSTSGHASGTKPWPTPVTPSIGASGAWDPDASTTPSSSSSTVDRPTTTRCSRCGERSPVVTTTSPTPTATSSAAADPGEQAADPEPSVAVELLALVNRDRVSAGCGPVALHPSLTEQSQTHAEQQAADDTMHHSGGVDGFDTWGENVAYGYDTEAAAHDAWMNSADHRANILNCGFTVMGAGAADSATGVRYWTEQLAA